MKKFFRIGILMLLYFTQNGYCSAYCSKGEVYRNYINRFEIICPANQTDADSFGIYFEDEKNFSFYTFRIYKTPPLHSKELLTIGNVISDIKSMMTAQAEIIVLREEPINYQGHIAVNFDFIYQQGSPLYYYTRLIDGGDAVFWLYLSMPSGPESVIVTNESEVTKAKDIADKYFDSLKILK